MILVTVCWSVKSKLLVNCNLILKRTVFSYFGKVWATTRVLGQFDY